MEQIIVALLSLLSMFFGNQSVDLENTIAHATSTAEVIEVVDGDTIRVLINDQVESVRYIGIDTPEPYSKGQPECFSLEASAKNQELVAGKMVTLGTDTEDRDKYDRLLRYVYVDEMFVNQVLVEEGYADTLSIQPNTKFKDELNKAKKEAQADNRGLWNICK